MPVEFNKSLHEKQFQIGTTLTKQQKERPACLTEELSWDNSTVDIPEDNECWTGTNRLVSSRRGAEGAEWDRLRDWSEPRHGRNTLDETIDDGQADQTTRTIRDPIETTGPTTSGSTLNRTRARAAGGNDLKGRDLYSLLMRRSQPTLLNRSSEYLKLHGYSWHQVPRRQQPHRKGWIAQPCHLRRQGCVDYG